MDLKKTKYEPIGEYLCAETAMMQAARSLDIAAYLAVESRDTENLIRVGIAWAEMATNIASGIESSDDDSENDDGNELDKSDKERKRVVGFSGSKES